MYCCVCGRKINRDMKSFHCAIENDVYNYCRWHSFIGKIVLKKCRKNT
jgi:hypothetical protein